MEAVRYEKCAKYLNLVHSLREIINNVLSKILNSVLDHSNGWCCTNKPSGSYSSNDHWIEENNFFKSLDKTDYLKRFEIDTTGESIEYF